MQQRSFGRQIWRIFGPLIIKGIVAFCVELVVMTIYMMPRMPEMLASIKTQEEYVQKVTELAAEISKYTVEISALSALAVIPILAWMYRKDRKQEKLLAQEAGQTEKKIPLWNYILAAGISIPFAVGLNNILTLSDLAELSEAYQEAAKTLYTPSFVVQILCIGIIIPIMEELIFRGMVYKRIRVETSMMPALLYSSVFFGLYHGNMVQMIYGGLAGALLAYLYEKFGSLKAPVLAHMLMNITACVLTEVDGINWMFADPLRMGIITVACAAAASTMFVLIREKVN